MRAPCAHHSAFSFIVALLLLCASLVTPASARAANAAVDINTASAAELNAVKGIGAATAKKIIANRPYQSVDELSKAGLTARAIDKLRVQLTVGAGTGSVAPVAATAKPDKAARKKVQDSAVTTADTPPTSSAPVDLNAADSKAIEALPGVGPSLAASIIAARPYKSVDDLAKVKGIGAGKFAKLKDKVTVAASAASAPATAPPAARTVKARPTAPVATPVPAAGTVNAPTASATPAATVAPRTPAVKPATVASSERVNINTASIDQLNALPGIGMVKAQAIIDGRPYAAPEDIMKVRGIKQGVFAKIKDLITVK